MKEVSSRRWFWTTALPPILWACLIFIGSSIPSTAIPVIAIFRSDKLLHAGVYFVLAFFTHRALRTQTAFEGVRQVALGMTVFLIALYGITDELHQHYVPGRSMDVFDWFADVLGALLYALLWKRWTIRKAKREAAAAERVPVGSTVQDTSSR